jgi:hypothetical protein
LKCPITRRPVGLQKCPDFSDKGQTKDAVAPVPKNRVSEIFAQSSLLNQ